MHLSKYFRFKIAPDDYTIQSLSFHLSDKQEVEAISCSAYCVWKEYVAFVFFDYSFSNASHTGLTYVSPHLNLAVTVRKKVISCPGA